MTDFRYLKSIVHNKQKRPAGFAKYVDNTQNSPIAIEAIQQTAITQ